MCKAQLVSLAENGTIKVLWPETACMSHACEAKSDQRQQSHRFVHDPPERRSAPMNSFKIPQYATIAQVSRHYSSDWLIGEKNFLMGSYCCPAG